jgi:hypothetical protein
VGCTLGPTLPSGIGCAGRGCTLPGFELGGGERVGYLRAAVFVADIFEAVFAAFEVEDPIVSSGVDAECCNLNVELTKMSSCKIQPRDPGPCALSLVFSAL